MQPIPDPEIRLTEDEQRAVLKSLKGLECLVNYHDVRETEDDAIEPGAGLYHRVRAYKLLAVGRRIIAEDPDIYSDVDKHPFRFRYSEQTTTSEGGV